MNSTPRNRLQWLGLGLSLVAALSMWLYVNRVLRPYQIADAAAHNRPRGNLSDLYPRWFGARQLLLYGQDPYDADTTRGIQAGYYGRVLDPRLQNDPKDQQGFAYPVYVVFFLAPAVRFPFGVVRQAFLWLLVVLSAASVWLWLSALRWEISAISKLTWIVLVLGSFPAIQGFKLQQLSLAVAALMAFAIYAVTRGWLVWAGLALAAASIKPQLILLLVLWLCVWAAGNWRSRQRFYWSLAASAVALVAGGELVLPGWITRFREASIAYYGYTGGGRSVLDVLITPIWGRLCSAILVGAVLVLLWHVRQEGENSVHFQWSLALVLSTTLVVIPMFAPYNQVLLVPALMLVVRALPRLWQGPWIMRLLVVLTAASILWPWLAAALLDIALLFLPAHTVWSAWSLPLFTNFAIPVTVLSLLLAARSVLCERV